MDKKQRVNGNSHASPVAERRAWVRPRLVRMKAGSAQLQIGDEDDGVDYS